MTTTLGTASVSSGSLHIERYGIPHADLAMVDDTVLPLGSTQTLVLGTISHVGAVVSGGDFGGQARTHWSGGAGGLDANGNGVSAWAAPVDARPYHDDNGIMLSAVLADLERDAAVAVGASPLGTTLEVPDVRLDVAGAWLRPAALARDLLDALTVAAGQPRGTWWIATDGSTHLGPRTASSVTLSDLTIGDYDPALLRAVVQLSGDDYATLLPGATLTAPGLPAPLLVACLIVTVEGDDIAAELWGEASHAELFARVVEHVVAPSLAYLAPVAYTVMGVASDGRVQVSAPPGSPWPDAPLLGHAPGLPGVSFMMAPGAPVLVSCVGGSPGAPVCVAYPAGTSDTLPGSVTFDANGPINIGGSGGGPLAIATKSDARDAALLTGVNAALAALGLAQISLPASAAAVKAYGV